MINESRVYAYAVNAVALVVSETKRFCTRDRTRCVEHLDATDRGKPALKRDIQHPCSERVNDKVAGRRGIHPLFLVLHR